MSRPSRSTGGKGREDSDKAALGLDTKSKGKASRREGEEHSCVGLQWQDYRQKQQQQHRHFTARRFGVFGLGALENGII